MIARVRPSNSPDMNKFEERRNFKLTKKLVHNTGHFFIFILYLAFIWLGKTLPLQRLECLCEVIIAAMLSNPLVQQSHCILILCILVELLRFAPFFNIVCPYFPYKSLILHRKDITLRSPELA